MEKEENIVSCGKKNLTQREIEMQGEIVSLKRQIGGLKTSNVNYKKQVEKLKSEVERYKALDKEGDGLYEQKIAECDALKQELETKLSEKQDIIETLQESVQKERIRVSELESRVDSQKSIITDLENTVFEQRKPWWKKLF